jgi:ABC-2 type transport system permease protein
MGAVWTITRKDLKLRLRDRTVLLFGVVAPLALASVLGLVFSGAEDRVAFDLGIVAGADDEVAGPFLEEVLPELEADGLVTDVRRYGDRAAMVTAVDAGEVPVGVVFAPSSGLAPAPIEVLGSVDAPTAPGITGAIVSGYARDVAVVTTVVQAGIAGGATDVEALVTAARAEVAVVAFRDAPVGNVPLDVTTYTAAGISVFFLLFSVGLVVTALLEEERDGTMARLASAPIAASAPILAKALGAFIVGVLSMLVLAGATTVLVGADWGDPGLLVLLIIAAVLAAIGVVGLIASVTRTPESASSALGVVGTVLGALGGSFFPLPSGGALAVVASVTPHRWFLRGMTRLAGGGSAADLVAPIGALLVIAAVTGAVAALRFHQRLEA